MTNLKSSLDKFNRILLYYAVISAMRKNIISTEGLTTHTPPLSIYYYYYGR